MADRPIMLSVYPRGTAKFTRYFVSDEFLRVWDGQQWNDDQSKALLFANSNAACVELQRLLKLSFSGKRVRRFRAPIYVTLHSDDEITEEELVNWLVRSSKLLVDPKHGLGPKDALGLTMVDWGEIQEIPE